MPLNKATSHASTFLPVTAISRQSSLYILVILHNVLDHRRVCQRRYVAQLVVLVSGDLAQDSAHDLTRARLGQTLRELMRGNTAKN